MIFAIIFLEKKKLSLMVLCVLGRMMMIMIIKSRFLKLTVLHV
jgi:hypothetical protein